MYAYYSGVLHAEALQTNFSRLSANCWQKVDSPSLTQGIYDAMRDLQKGKERGENDAYIPKVAKCYSKPVPANNQFELLMRDLISSFSFLNHQCEGARMLELSESNIHLNATATNKLQAIEMAASALEQAGNVEQGYLQGMLGREQQTSTFLGNGIAIPHGTLETRSMVKKTGVQVFQFPQGIEWGEGNIAYVVIGIAARSDEHLALLRQLTHVLGDEDTVSFN